MRALFPKAIFLTFIQIAIELFALFHHSVFDYVFHCDVSQMKYRTPMRICIYFKFGVAFLVIKTCFRPSVVYIVVQSKADILMLTNFVVIKHCGHPLYCCPLFSLLCFSTVCLITYMYFTVMFHKWNTGPLSECAYICKLGLHFGPIKLVSAPQWFILLSVLRRIF